MTGLNSAAIIDALVSDALTLGVFRKVNAHEPKNAPGKGLTASFWVDRVRPARSSGLKSTSALLVVNCRIQTPMISEPQDGIDPELTRALDLLLARYVGSFTLGGLVRSIDVRGMEGIQLEARAAYIEQDRNHYRTYELSIPMIINDVWDETP